MSKRTLLFAVAGYNLAETGRMIEIARAARADFDVVFASYGGGYEELIRSEGFELRLLEPRLGDAKLAQLKRVLAGEPWNTLGYFSARELTPRVETELALFRELEPAAVLTGWCLSVAISARAAKVPFVNVLHSTSVREYYEAGLQEFPDRMYRLERFFSRERLRRRINQHVLTRGFTARPFNAVGRRHGLARFTAFIDVIEGDHVLLADIPQWVGLPEVRAKLHYVGPLNFHLDVPVPPELRDLPRGEPIVYFAMGSSGNAELVRELIEGFRGKPYRVIAPVRDLVEGLQIDVPANVIVTGLLPAHEVNAMADLSLIHGGQNTVMSACIAGTPIVGMGMHPEQEANLEACVRKGFAIRLNRWRDGAGEVLDAIERLLADPDAKKAVGEFQQQLAGWDGPARAAQFLRETFAA